MDGQGYGEGSDAKSGSVHEYDDPGWRCDRMPTPE